MKKNRRFRKAVSMLVLLSMVIMLLGGCGQSGVDNSTTQIGRIS